MNIDDVWLDFGKHLQIFYRADPDSIPNTSGVYAWFYPLTVCSVEYSLFLKEIRGIFQYQNLQQSDPSIDFNWWKISMRPSFQIKEEKIASYTKEKWENIFQNSNADTRDAFKRALMCSSIFMPPLYVGKAVNLKQRFSSHVSADTTKNVFRKRFEEYANAKKLRFRKVEELIFATIETSFVDDEFSGNEQSHSVLEEILKFISRPPFSER